MKKNTICYSFFLVITILTKISTQVKTNTKGIYADFLTRIRPNINFSLTSVIWERAA